MSFLQIQARNWPAHSQRLHRRLCRGPASKEGARRRQGRPHGCEGGAVHRPGAQLREPHREVGVWRLLNGIKPGRIRIAPGAIKRIRPHFDWLAPTHGSDATKVFASSDAQRTAARKRRRPRPSVEAFSIATLLVTQSTCRSSSNRFRNVCATPSGPTGDTDCKAIVPAWTPETIASSTCALYAVHVVNVAMDGI